MSQAKKPEITPSSLSILRRTDGVAPLTPEDEAFVNDYARQHAIPKKEALRRLLQIAESQDQTLTRKLAVAEQSNQIIQQAQDLGLVNPSPDDIVTQFGRAELINIFGDRLKKGDKDLSFEDVKQIAIMNFYLKLAGLGDSNQAWGKNEQMIAEMKAENEKLRQDLKDQENKRREDIEKMESKIREMVFEKKLQNMQEDIQGDRKNLANQLSSLEQKIEALKNVPPNPTPEQKKDAIGQLEEIGGQVERIKKALSPFGFLSQGQPSAPGADPYKNPDGTIDYFRFTVDKLDNTVGRVMSAWEKKAPRQKEVEETPQPQYRYRQLTPKEYCDILLSKPVRTSEEEQWLENYRGHLAGELAKLQPGAQAQERLETTERPDQGQVAADQPAQEATTKCRLCGVGEVVQDGFCKKCLEQQNQANPEKSSMIERLKLEELKRASDLASLGI